jgi:hypothetical protein
MLYRKDRTLLGCDMAEAYLPFVMIWDDAFGWCDPHKDALYSPTHWMEQPALRTREHDR